MIIGPKKWTFKPQLKCTNVIALDNKISKCHLFKKNTQAHFPNKTLHQKNKINK